MKKLLIILILANCLLSCQQNYSEQVPKCNDSIPLNLARELVKREIAAITLASATNNNENNWSKMVEEYQSGKRFDSSTDQQIEIAIEIADSLHFKIEDILPTNSEEKLKKCDCEASLTTKEGKSTIFYSAQNTDAGTFVKLKEK